MGIVWNETPQMDGNCAIGGMGFTPHRKDDAKGFRADDQIVAQIPTLFVLIMGFWVWLMLGCWYRVMTDTRFSFSSILEEWYRLILDRWFYL